MIDYEAERRRAAAARSYTTQAVATLFLYALFWVPGAIANALFYLAAREDKARSGVEPAGMSCLGFMLLVFCALPLGALALMLVVGALTPH